MKKSILTLLFVAGFSFVPATSFAKSVEANILFKNMFVDERTTCDFVVFSDGSYGYFYSNGYYEVYDIHGNLKEKGC